MYDHMQISKSFCWSDSQYQCKYFSTFMSQFYFPFADKWREQLHSHAMQLTEQNVVLSTMQNWRQNKRDKHLENNVMEDSYCMQTLVHLLHLHGQCLTINWNTSLHGEVNKRTAVYLRKWQKQKFGLLWISIHWPLSNEVLFPINYGYAYLSCHSG